MKVMRFDNYEGYKKNISEILGLTEREKSVIKVIKTRQDLAGQIDTIKSRLNQEHFRVLVMGQFSAGKSTFINALLGEKILPAKAMPATAIITEIKYDDKKRVVIYPKKGKWQNGDEPFEIEIGEIRNYCLIKNMDGNVIESPFEKMEVFWPLQLLKDGVEIIDSPGLNDPNSHDIITLNYLPNADTIIYAMTCTAAYDAIDKETIEKLRAFQYKSIMFVLPYFDVIKQDPDQVDEFVDSYKGILMSLTELGESGVHFVCSTQAIAAKKNGDLAELKDSGVYNAEKSLEDYLVRRKGIDKLTNICRQFETINSDADKTANEQLLNADVPLAEFEDRVNSVQAKMETAKLKAQLICKTFDDGIRDMLNEIRGMASDYVGSCSGQVDSWINAYKPSTTIKITSIKKSAETIVGEYDRNISEKMKVYGAKWSNEKLIPFINGSLAQKAKEMKEMVDNFNKDINSIKVDLAFTSPNAASAIGEEQGSSTATKIAAVIYGFATMDWGTAAMAGVFGMKGLLRAITTEIAAGVAIGIVSLFTPIGWVGLLGATIAALFAAGKWNMSAMDGDIKKKLKTEYKKIYTDPQKCDAMVKDIVSQVDKKMDALRKEIKEAAYGDIKQIQTDIDNAIRDKENTELDIENRKRELESAIAENRSIKSKITEFLA